MSFSRNGTVQFLLVRTQLTDPKMLHSNQNGAGREGVRSMTETFKQKKLSGSKITGKPQGTVTANTVFLRQSCAAKPTLCKVKDGKRHVQPVPRTTNLQVGKLVVQGWFMLFI